MIFAQLNLRPVLTTRLHGPFVRVVMQYRPLISNRLTCLVHAKSTGEFRLTLDLAKAQSEVWSPLIAEIKLRTKRSLLSPNEKNEFTFWLISVRIYTTQRQSQPETQPKSRMTHCDVPQPQQKFNIVFLRTTTTVQALPSSQTCRSYVFRCNWRGRVADSSG